MKRKKKVVLGSGIAIVSNVLLVNGNVSFAETSQATVELKTAENKGQLAFDRVTESAQMDFLDTKLTADVNSKVIREKAPGSSKIIVNDSRQDMGNKKGAYSISANFTNTVGLANPSDFILLIKSGSGVEKEMTEYTEKVLSTTPESIYTGTYQQDVTEREITLNPELKIINPKLTSGVYTATIEWTLTTLAE